MAEKQFAYQRVCLNKARRMNIDLKMSNLTFPGQGHDLTQNVSLVAEWIKRRT